MLTDKLSRTPCEVDRGLAPAGRGVAGHCKASVLNDMLERIQQLRSGTDRGVLALQVRQSHGMHFLGGALNAVVV